MREKESGEREREREREVEKVRERKIERGEKVIRKKLRFSPRFRDSVFTFPKRYSVIVC